MKPCQHSETVSGCHLCWLYENHAGYRKRWGGGELPKKSRGLGDTVAKGIARATLGLVKPCGSCKERQARLNGLWPYKPG